MDKRKLLLFALISNRLLFGCSDTNLEQKPQPLPLVAVESVKPIHHYAENKFVGRVEAIEDASIVAQVSGYLTQRFFTEGELVKKGQALFQIDPAAYKAKVASAKAAMTQAKASVTSANLDWNRGKRLLPKGGISQSEFDHLTSAKLKADAALELAKAELIAAELDLAHTTIKAPFSGKISQSKVSIGDLISPSSGVLTTVVSLNPVYAAFSMSEKQRLLMGTERLKQTDADSNDDLEVALNLNKDMLYEHLGKLKYSGNRIDLQTGTISLRAQFPNPEARLLPGQYVEVTVREKQPQKRLVIPRLAVQSDLEGDYVMVLKSENKVERRNIVLGEQTKAGIIVTSGLADKEQVLVKGLQRAKNGMTVQLDTLSADKQGV